MKACVHVSGLIDVASKWIEETSQGTRFFNDSRTGVEPYFECEEIFVSRRDATTKLILTIDADSDGVKE